MQHTIQNKITSSKILDAAAQAFAAYGYKKTTLEDISMQLQVGKTAIYYYFKSKEAVFSALVEREAEVLRETLHNAILKEKEATAKLKVYIEVRMAAFEKLSSYYSVLRHELFERLQLINAQRGALDAAEQKIVSDIIETGKAGGCFRNINTEEVSALIVELMKSLEIPFFVNAPEKDNKARMQLLSDLLLNGLKEGGHQSLIHLTE